MELTTFWLAIAAGGAGAVNAIAGGGTLITFPALLAAGYPARVANVTSSVAIWPGTVGGSLAYREEIGARRMRLVQIAVPGVLGAAVGSVVLLVTSQRLFDAIVPYLILFASGLLLANRWLSRFVASRGFAASADGQRVPPMTYIVMFLVGAYGGYFGAGLGILTLALLSILAPDDLQHANAVKGMLALLVNFVALVVFALFGPVVWDVAAVMAICAIAGGYLGVSVAKRLDANVLRGVIVIWGMATGLVLLVQ